MPCCLSSHATIVAPGLVRSAENADLADTSEFDRFAALGIMLFALIAFARWWTKLSPSRGREPRETQKVPPSGNCRVIRRVATHPENLPDEAHAAPLAFGTLALP
jgi:hypothetical protein